jgi:SAM-dependent methyltransferase
MLCALAQPERTLWGLELDPSLLRLGRQAVAELAPAARRGVRLVHGDMRGFALGRRFERVILPYNALYCLLTRRDAEQCLSAVHAALEPGGLFAFDVWNADRLHEEGLAPTEEDEAVAAFGHGGCNWRVFERCRRARGPQRLDVTYDYVPERGAARSQVVRQRYYLSSELFGLLKKCGFAVQSKLGSFPGARSYPRGTRLVVTARPVG